MATYLFFDTIRLNPAAGGVLNVCEVLLRGMRLSADDTVQPVSERHPRIYEAARRLKVSRFLLETLLYNYHLVRALATGQEVFSLFPNYFLPFALFGRNRDSIVVVHDLQYRSFPQYFSRIKRLWLDWNLRRLVRSRADVVFISRSSQQDFERCFGPCERGSVIFNPVDAVRRASSAGPACRAKSRTRYLIAAYHYYPHKNFDGVLRLFERMRCLGLVDQLYITGNGAADVERMIAEIAPGARDSVRHRGHVSRTELIRLYLGATAFISLSTSEGFNLSAAEAATLGVPLLLSDIPAHRELFAGYGFLIGSGRCDLYGLARYLREHQRARPAWPLADECAPNAVAARYLRLKQRQHAFAGAVQ